MRPYPQHITPDIARLLSASHDRVRNELEDWHERISDAARKGQNHYCASFRGASYDPAVIDRLRADGWTVGVEERPDHVYGGRGKTQIVVTVSW